MWCLERAGDSQFWRHPIPRFSGINHSRSSSVQQHIGKTFCDLLTLRAELEQLAQSLGIAAALMIGTAVLMASLAFSFQRYFEYQIEEARKISQ